MLARLRSVPPGFWLGLVATLVALGLLAAPVAGAPATRAIGNFQSEAATHVPALAAALRGLPVNGPFLLAEYPLRPDEVTGAMYEPITTLTMWPFFAAAGKGARGFTVAWNAWHLLMPLLGALGAWIGARAWLGEERDPRGWGAGLAMAVVAGSVFVQLEPEVGRTEVGNFPLYALHAGLLLRAVRKGGRAWVPAALSVVPVVWAGGYAAVFFAVAETAFAVWILRTSENRASAWKGLVGVAIAAGLAVAPLAWALQQHPYVGTVGRSAQHATPSVALKVLFVGSDNLLRQLPGYEVAPFVGIATLLLAVAGVLRLRAALGPLLIALLLYWIAAGPAPTVGDTPLWSPAAVLGAIPGPSGVLRGWSRIFVFSLPFFALCAAALPRGRSWMAIVATVAVLGESAWYRPSPASWWTLEVPSKLAELRATEGATIALPIDGLERARRWLEPPALPDVWKLMSDHDLFKYFQDALPNEPELFRDRFGSPAVEYDPCALLADAVSLRSLGFTDMYLRRDFLPQDGRGIAGRAMKAVFGTPREEGVWRLPEVVPPECAAGADNRPALIKLHGEDGADKERPRTPAEREAIRKARQAERERVRQERLRQRAEGQGERKERPPR